MAELYWIRTPEMTDVFTQGYVGMSTRSAKVRWIAHKAASKVKEKQHLPIYRAFNKYGADGLVMDVLVSGPDDYITDLEITLRPRTGIGWNCAQGGQDTGKGRIQSEEEKEKRAKKLRGRKHTEESKRKMSLSSKGKPKSESHKEHCRQAALGHKQSAETVAKRMANMPPRIVTEDQKRLLSDFQKSLMPWERSRSVTVVWYHAKDVYDAVNGEPVSQRTLSKLLGVKDSEVSKLHEMLAEGWNPSEDSKWVEWQTSISSVPNVPSGWKIGDPIPFSRKIADLENAFDRRRREPWINSRANKENWANAETILNLMIENRSQYEICKVMGLDPKERPIDTIYKKIKSGWVPSEDPSYLAWLDQYNKTRSENESTLAA